MSSNPLSASLLKTFEKSYDPDRESRAEQSRGELLESFPITRLNRLKVDDYVIDRCLLCWEGFSEVVAASRTPTAPAQVDPLL